MFLVTFVKRYHSNVKLKEFKKYLWRKKCICEQIWIHANYSFVHILPEDLMPILTGKCNFFYLKKVLEALILPKTFFVLSFMNCSYIRSVGVLKLLVLTQYN